MVVVIKKVSLCFKISRIFDSIEIKCIIIKNFIAGPRDLSNISLGDRTRLLSQNDILKMVRTCCKLIWNMYRLVINVDHCKNATSL